MAVATSALFELVDALLAKFRADATLTGTTYNVQIIDGPILTDVSRPNILFVGGQPSDQTGSQPDGDFTQAWGELGARARYETLSVACELMVRTGATDMAAMRLTARTLLAAIESALRTDFTLSISRLMWCEVHSGQLIQEQTTKGATVAVPFVIAAKARLASQ